MIAPRPARRPLVLWIVGLVGALVVLLVATIPATLSPPGDRSSFANGRSGTLALVNLLDARGARVLRLTGSGFAGALRSAAVVVEAGPSHPFTAAQRRALVRFVAGGGTLLYAAAVSAVDTPVLRAFGIAPGPVVAAPAAAPLLPVMPPHAGLVRLGRAHLLRGLVPGVLPLLPAPRGVVAVARPLGHGHLYALGSVGAVDNAGLRRDGDAAFVLGLLALAPGRRVVVDEIHHGFVAGTGAGALVFGTPLGLALLLLAVAALVAGATQGRRLGRPLPPPELQVVRSTDDHLRAIADLYARTRDRGAVAGRIQTQLMAVVREATGGAPQADAATVTGALRVLRPAEAEAVGATLAGLAELERGPCPPARLLELARGADSCARRVRGSPDGNASRAAVAPRAGPSGPGWR